MKRLVFVSLLLITATLGMALQAGAQHFISVQSDDKQPFTIQVNGTSLNSSKTGSVRIANLSAGNYNLVIKPAGKAAPQNFACVVDKADLTYALANQAKKGWVLKNTKSTQVIIAANAAAAQPVVTSTTSTQPLNTRFAIMLSQVINDPDLLNSTPWVLSTKVGDGADEGLDNIAMAMTDAQEKDTSSYVAETKGIIKASERSVRDGIEMVFVDFTAYSGDTVHIVIPTTDNGDDTDAVAAQLKTAVKTQPVADAPLVPQQTAATNVTDAVKIDTTATVAKKTEEATQPFDTSANKQYSNPFFKGQTTAAPVVTAPVETVKKDDNDGAIKKDNSEGAKPADVEKTTTITEPLAATSAVNTGVKADCKKMLSDNDAEKLRHKVYLETDQDKMLEITKRALKDKCISTAQVKDLASFFLSDDARYSFFFTVYPNVYDYGNFKSLKTYMIAPAYKDMFDAMVK